MALRLLVAVVVTVVCGGVGSSVLMTEAYLYDEYVPAAWRGQFRGSRTSWNDLTGRSVPRFRRDTSAVLQIPLPEGADATRGVDEYKVSYSIDSERYVTVWLPVLEKKQPRAALPGIRIELMYRAAEVIGVRGSIFERGVRVGAASGGGDTDDDELRAGDDALMLQATRIHNATLWPKHVLVTYTWTRDTSAGASDVDIGFALTTLSAIALLAVMGIACHAAFAIPMHPDVTSVGGGGGRTSIGRQAGAGAADTRSSKMDMDAASLRALMNDAARELGSGVAADMDHLSGRVAGRRPYTLDNDDNDGFASSGTRLGGRKRTYE